MKISKRQLRRVIREAVRLLSEEEYDRDVSRHKKHLQVDARDQIRAALKDAGLVDEMAHYSGIRAYLEKGYKDHPDYDGKLEWDGQQYVGGVWDTVAHGMLQAVERQLG